MNITNSKEMVKALKEGPYAWPGGYPLFFITSDGAALSFDAVKENLVSIFDSIKTETNDGWRIVGVDINWEDADLCCDHTGNRIESAYAEPDNN